MLSSRQREPRHEPRKPRRGPTAKQADLDSLLAISLDLTRALSTERRYDHLLEAIASSLPSDAAAVLRLQPDGSLRPIASRGLSADIMGRSFHPSEHPRLRAILASGGPLVFANDDPMPDPYDGFLQNADQELHVHSCMGAPLRVDGALVGALTLDTLEPGSFDDVNLQLAAAFAALAAASLRTAELIESLEAVADQRTRVAQDLVASALAREGGDLVGKSTQMDTLRHEIRMVAESDLTVLVTGETGTGKELIARKIHSDSRRSSHPLVYINCAALPETLAESELFGHVRGAFSGAENNRPGKFELANHGTLFLDEIGELVPPIQAKLLRALQFGEVQRVGADRATLVDVRVIAATNRDLPLEVKKGTFRADLYHRLSVFPVLATPLRERPADLPIMIGHFLDRACRRLGAGTIPVSRGALAALAAYSWPGNARELDHVMTRAALRAVARAGNSPALITEDLLDVPLDEAPAPHTPVAPERGEHAATYDALSFGEAIDQFKRQLVQRAVDQSGGNWSAAARQLDLHRSNLHRIGQRLGLKP